MFRFSVLMATRLPSPSSHLIGSVDDRPNDQCRESKRDESEEKAAQWPHIVAPGGSQADKRTPDQQGNELDKKRVEKP
jgi:hypothetical protein